MPCNTDIIIIGHSEAHAEALRKACLELSIAANVSVEVAKLEIEKVLYSEDLTESIERLKTVSSQASEIVKSCADAFKYVPGKQKNGVKRKCRRNRFQANKFGQYE